MSATQPGVTELIAACAAGEPAAADRLFARVYDDLCRIARRQLRAEADGHTLDTTSLVHEAYLALAEPGGTGWRDRVHFFAVASRAMRHILIDHERRRVAAKRGGDALRIPLSDDLAAAGALGDTADLLALDEALGELESHDARMARVVECRFFGGMSVEETAAALGVGVRTVERDWTRAKAYLFRQLRA